MFNAHIDDSWEKQLKSEFDKPYFQSLMKFLKDEEKNKQIIFPPKPLVFNALFQTPFNAVKVVIMGQDPYHGPGQAHGLSFSVCEGIPPPPSLKNIFKELKTDLNIPFASTGCLLSWAHQGVLLLNATLTVRKGEARSHYGKGWETFTDKIIEMLALRNQPIIFLLWGKSAQEKCKQILNHIQKDNVFILTSTHPSPLSAHGGFLGCKHFSKANKKLKEWGLTPINWNLEQKE